MALGMVFYLGSNGILPELPDQCERALEFFELAAEHADDFRIANVLQLCVNPLLGKTATALLPTVRRISAGSPLRLVAPANGNLQVLISRTRFLRGSAMASSIQRSRFRCRFGS